MLLQTPNGLSSGYCNPGHYDQGCQLSPHALIYAGKITTPATFDGHAGKIGSKQGLTGLFQKVVLLINKEKSKSQRKNT